MHQGVKKRDKPPLLVKEVILPCGQDSSGSSKSSWSKNDKEIMEGSQEISCHGYKKVDQLEPEGLSLMFIEEKSLENYFEGTRKGKKVRKMKVKHHRSVMPSTELFPNEAQSLSEGKWKQTEEAVAKEDKTEDKLVSLKIYEYEKTREEAHKKNYERQKRAEEEYIRRLETLAIKWFKTGKRRDIIKKLDDDFALPKSMEKSSEGTSNRRTKKISTSRKHQTRDNRVPPSRKSKKVFKEMHPSALAQPTDSHLEDDFHEKLVIGDDTSDEFDYADQNLEFRNSSR